MNTILQGQIKGADKELSNLSNRQRALHNIGGRPNKNLLINAYFVGGGSQQGGGQFPINQRGQTSYGVDLGTGRIDRFEGSASMTLQEDCIHLVNKTNLNSLWWLRQYFKADRFEVGTTLTVSALVKVQPTVPFNVVLQSTAITNAWSGFVYAQKTGNYELVSYTTTLQAALSSAAGFGLVTHEDAATGNSDYIDVKAMKVEFGTVQTLAYQDEDGNWQLFETPDFQEELAKCQGYLIPVRRNSCTGPASSSTIAYLYFPVPVSMRATPVLQGTPPENLFPSDGHTVETFSVFSSSALSNMVTFRVTGTGFTEGTMYALNNDIGFLSAEL